MTQIPAIEGGTPIRNQFLVYGQPQIEQAEIDEVVDSLRRAWLGTGPKVARFEEDFRTYMVADYAVAVNSCTAGLHLACLVAGFKPGDEVITTTMTFCATANAIIHSGATPVFADCERESFNIDLADVERKITPRTKGIIPVHFAGRPCDMDPLMDLARAHRLTVIEDCAHAIEAEYHGRKSGSFGELASFSFYATKNLAMGEGGMLLTGNREYADKLKMLALHGMTKDAWKRFGDTGYKHYQVAFPGFKYNMMDLQAAIGLHQLKRLETNWLRRRQLWAVYQDAFADLPLVRPLDPEPDTRHAYHLYTILPDLERLRVTRDFIMDALTRENIGVGVHYLPVHGHSHYSDAYGLKAGDFPNATWIGERTVSLPLSPKLTDGDVADVIEAVRRILKYYRK